MARPHFLKTLPKSATVAYDFIRSGVRQGLSARSMESVIRSTLTPISRTTINQVVQGIKGIEAGVADLRFLKRGAIPDPTRIKLSRGDILTKYSFTFRINGINPFNGQLETRFTQVVTDELLSREQLEAVAEQTITDVEGSTTFDDATYTLVDALQRA